MMKNLSYHLMPLTSFGICEVYIKLKWIHGMKICQTSVLFQSRSGYIFLFFFVRSLFSSLWVFERSICLLVCDFSHFRKPLLPSYTLTLVMTCPSKNPRSQENFDNLPTLSEIVQFILGYCYSQFRVELKQILITYETITWLRNCFPWSEEDAFDCNKTSIRIVTKNLNYILSICSYCCAFWFIVP